MWSILFFPLMNGSKNRVSWAINMVDWALADPSQSYLITIRREQRIRRWKSRDPPPLPPLTQGNKYMPALEVSRYGSGWTCVGSTSS